MRRQGLTIFIIFFGIATLDALTSGRWLRIAFWLAMGAGFVAFDWWTLRSRRREVAPAPSCGCGCSVPEKPGAL